MKPVLSLLLACLAFSLFATSYTVSNLSTQPAQFDSISTAIASASPGDTIYLMPSPNRYDGIMNITFTKRLVFIGPGVWPTSNGGIAEVHNCTIDSAASGSRFYGISFRYVNARAVAGAFVNNIVMEGCRFNGSKMELRGSNWTVQNCVFLSGGTGGIQGDFTGSSNVLVSNCLFGNGAIVRDFYTADANFRNCVFFDGADVFLSCENIVIENNIFYDKSPETCVNCVFNNNITYSTTQDTIPYGTNTGTGNFSAQDPLFESVPLPGSAVGSDFNTVASYDFHLKPASPGKNAGTDGTDIGLYGGSDPFNPAGPAPVPQIELMQIKNAVVPIGGDIEVKVIATSPN